MLHTIWKGGSLRSWIALGMAIAVVPLAASAFAGYLLLHHGVIVAFQDVAARQRDQIDPLQHLRLLVLDAETPLDIFVDEGDPAQPATYRAMRQRIEVAFAELEGHLQSDAELHGLADRARDDWTAADRVAGEALSVRRAPGDAAGEALMERFHGLVDAAVDKLGAVNDALARDLRADHDEVLRDVERSKWIAGIAATVSALAILIGVILISRVMKASVERLVSGAELFAAGNREHRIDVQVPPELQRVAEEFNRMIGRIHESEDALADLARRDSLTLLANRRAFDEGMNESLARQQRFGESFALLIFDLDRFKQINDRYGHAVGDDVLRASAQALASQLRPFDRLFRIGGEEFAALLPASDRTAALAAGERLRLAIARHPIPVGDSTIDVTVSIGVAVAAPGAMADSLMAAADAALYRAKSGGRNQVVLDDSPGRVASP